MANDLGKGASYGRPARVEDIHIILMHLICYYFMEGTGR